MAAAADRPPRKPISASQKGAYYKARSKKWLLARGYAVANMEEMRMIYAWPKPGAAPAKKKPALLRAVKQDQFGADLFAMRRAPDQDAVAVQVKGGKTAKSGLAAARREFRRHPFPDCIRREIHVWLLRARAPEIVDCSHEEYEPCEAGSARSQRAKTSAF